MLLPDDQGQLTRPMKRPKGTVTPCHNCPKIPDGVAKCRANAQELSEKNRQAYRHFRKCKVTGRWPEDPIVDRNAVVIQDTLDALERTDRQILFIRLGLLGMR